MKTPLIIYGAGGLGREVLSLVNALDTFEPLGFLDDAVPKGTLVKGLAVLGGVQEVASFHTPVHAVLAVGDPMTKAALVKKLAGRVRFATLKHPSVILQDGPSVHLGEGVILCAGTIITTDVVVGSHVLLNLNCTVGHDTNIGDFSSVMPGVNIAGQVTVGHTVLVGSGANILNNVTIGNGCKVGMGAVVIRDVAPGLTVGGVPAKSLHS